MNQYEEYIHLSRYARWNEKEQRRETWEETVDRYIEFFKQRTPKVPKNQWKELREAIYHREVMPSMRCLMTAGEALSRDNVAGFNCAYLAIDSPRCFDEMMYTLMCGTGVGFSVERQYISLLPEVAQEFHPTDTVIKVADSKIGWAKGFKQLLALLYAGEIPAWDMSKIRPAGARLKVFGGRASGPEPLEALFKYSVDMFRNAAGRKLTSYECHLLCCKIADIVVVGGVRRSALLSLSNLSDDRVRRAKHGQWWFLNPELALANNSACYTERPDFEAFLGEWHELYKSKSGERGVFSRPACQAKAASGGRRDGDWEFGTNPCSEIILRPNQFCNLSEVVIRPTDTYDDLRRKARLAAFCGTLQATLTNFRYLRSVWKHNTEEEALLGVSLTGIMDHPAMAGEYDAHALTDPTTGGKIPLPQLLTKLKEEVIESNKKWAKVFGINQSMATTCVKPSGTVSQLVDSASGVHPRYAEYYIRRVRADVKDPLSSLLKDQGVPCEIAIDKPSMYVFSFPMKSPKGSVVEGDLSSVDFLELINIYNKYWCEHKVSATVHYKEEEFLGVGQWLWDNFEDMPGVSFLPYDGHSYQQAPYEAIDKVKYNELVSTIPKVDWAELSSYEDEDMTTASQELACVSGSCEI